MHNNTRRRIEIRPTKRGLVKDDKQQSSDSIAAGSDSNYCFLLTFANGIPTV
jgi:hypothetical protein